MHRPFVLSLLGLVLLLGLSTAASAQPSELTLTAPGPADPLDELLADGWVIVNAGILQKQHDDGRRETLGFGIEGRTWHVNQLERELGQMLVDFEIAPSASLGAAIDQHRALLADARDGLVRARELEAAGQDESLSTVLKNCTVNYSWHAYADPGAKARADAAWYHSCGTTASTYAYAYCRKTVSGTTTSTNQTDPSGPGSNISSYASCNYAVTVNASDSTRDCYSYARGYVNEPGGFHEMTDRNYDCLPNSPQVTISGPLSASRYGDFDCGYVTWTASASGGSGGYSYQWKWNGSNVGTNSSSYTRNVCGYAEGSHSVGVTVTDSSSATGSDTHPFQILNWGGGSGGCDDPHTPYIEACEFEQ